MKVMMYIGETGGAFNSVVCTCPHWSSVCFKTHDTANMHVLSTLTFSFCFIMDYNALVGDCKKKKFVLMSYKGLLL